MPDKGCFAHHSLEGINPWYWLKRSGYNCLAAGENLAVVFLDSNLPETQSCSNTCEITATFCVYYKTGLATYDITITAKSAEGVERDATYTLEIVAGADPF